MAIAAVAATIAAAQPCCRTRKLDKEAMNTDLFYLACVTALTGLLWVPYILNRIAVRGLSAAVGYPKDPKPQSPWAVRLHKAHLNAVENLVVFGTLVLIAHVLGITSAVIATACLVNFWARLVHAAAFTFAVPWLRTLAFTIGFVAQAEIAWQVFTHV